MARKLLRDNDLPMMTTQLSDRERRILQAVIETYVETAEPAGSRTVAKRSDLGLSPATIRNTMSDLEEKGFLYHPHKSAGRIPTDRAYRAYVDALTVSEAGAAEARAIRDRLRADVGSQPPVIAAILEAAARVLGVVTQELGVAISPLLDETVLDRLELISVSSERLLLVLALRGGLARTIFVDLRSHVAPGAIEEVTRVLNERLAGCPLREIRSTMPARLRDATTAETHELLNIFIEEAEDLFQIQDPASVVLGSAKILAEQPEFASNERMHNLLDITERRDVLRQALAKRSGSELTITIGSEHMDPELSPFTLVTSSYAAGGLTGVIGVMGPTRMPYEKVIALVNYTSRVIGEVMS